MNSKSIKMVLPRKRKVTKLIKSLSRSSLIIDTHSCQVVSVKQYVFLSTFRCCWSKTSCLKMGFSFLLV